MPCAWRHRMQEKPMLTLQELSDRAEISDIVARLGYTQDDKDFDGLAALFATGSASTCLPRAATRPPTSPATNSPA